MSKLESKLESEKYKNNSDYWKLANKWCLLVLDSFKHFINPIDIIDKFKEQNFIDLNHDASHIYVIRQNDDVKDKNSIPRITCLIQMRTCIFNNDNNDEYEDERKDIGLLELRICINFYSFEQWKKLEEKDKHQVKSYTYKKEMSFLLEELEEEKIKTLENKIKNIYYNNDNIDLVCENCGEIECCGCKFKSLISYNDVCSICHEEIELLEKKILKCKHQLHRECYKKYNKKECPICRQKDIW